MLPVADLKNTIRMMVANFLEKELKDGELIESMKIQEIITVLRAKGSSHHAIEEKI